MRYYEKEIPDATNSDPFVTYTIHGFDREALERLVSLLRDGGDSDWSNDLDEALEILSREVKGNE